MQAPTSHRTRKLWVSFANSWGENWPQYTVIAWYKDFRLTTLYGFNKHIIYFTQLLMNMHEESLGYKLGDHCHAAMLSDLYYCDAIMGAVASQITSLPHDCLLNRLFRRRSMNTSKLRVTCLCVRGIHRGPVNSPHKCPVTRKIFPFDDVII